MKRMGIFSEVEKERYSLIWNELEKHFDEKDKRLLAAAMTKSLGFGGQKAICALTKLTEDTIKLGTEQLNGAELLPTNRCRRIGAGRKPITETYPDIEIELLKLVEMATQGDPMSPLLWTSKSLDHLTKELIKKGYTVSLPTVSALLAQNGYSMQANRKRFEENNPVDRILEKYPDIETELIKLVKEFKQIKSDETLGIPLSLSKEELKSITKELNDKEYSVSKAVVLDLLVKNELEETTKVDRNSQFEYINETVKKFIAQGNPVISVDGKKKENIGNYKNNGREYSSKGNPIEVNAYDFINKDNGKVTPYGIFDQIKNDGWVNVGTDYDTAEFSVESIRRWWYKMGEISYPNATELLINADSGGSNSAVSRLWKIEIQKLSNEINIPISVCHFPPGTSKWNKIEHRMFSAISINWRARPLVSHEVVVNLISSTTNKSGLTIGCELDKNKYAKGIKITDEELSLINIAKHVVNSKYNYTISPQLNGVS